MTLRLPTWALRWIVRSVANVLGKRRPDFTVGRPADPYLERWWVIPRNRFLNVYLHHFIRSDDDRALHDHPWLNFSIILAGRYVEHSIKAGGVHARVEHRQGEMRFRLPRAAHRLELVDGACWSLFITGPKVREWGFHCPEQGWIPWQRFTGPANKGEVGPGCEG